MCFKLDVTKIPATNPDVTLETNTHTIQFSQKHIENFSFFIFRFDLCFCSICVFLQNVTSPHILTETMIFPIEISLSLSLSISNFFNKILYLYIYIYIYIYCTGIRSAYQTLWSNEKYPLGGFEKIGK